MAQVEFKSVRIDTLHEDPANARKHPERNRAAVRSSLKEFGQVEALVVQKGTGRVIGGNCRLAELRAMGVEEAMVAEVDLGGVDATRLGLILNRSAETAEWDTDTLTDLLKSLDDEDALEGLGWDDEELEALLAEVEPSIEPSEGDDDAPEPDAGPPDSQPGEVYELGPHRLVCGDCEDSTVVEAALHETSPDVVITDPPYGIDAQKFGMGANDRKRKGSRAKVDGQRGSTEWDREAPRVAWLLAEAPMVCVWGGNYFNDLPTSNDWLVWDKKLPGLSFAEAELAWTNFGRRVRVLRHHWSHEKKEHITQKPLPVILWCLEFAPAAKVVFDPFAGSGTTLIACALTGRVARCIELDPRYCDVIRRRWTRWAKEHGKDPGPGALE